MHRLALRILSPDMGGDAWRHIGNDAAKAGEGEFAAFLVEHGLSGYWHHVLVQAKSAEFSPALIEVLGQRRLSDTAAYLGQKAALDDVRKSFESRGIVYAVIKGAHVRELVYPDPALRPAGDIDILVPAGARRAAFDALAAIDFSLQPNTENMSHEATFSNGIVDIDLHWDILRPGRTRIPVVEPMLARRQQCGGVWGLENSDATFLMLVHPAFAKYVCSPNMGLNRVADFALWVRNMPVDWDEVACRLEAAGLKTAAWTQLRWFCALLGPEALPLPSQFLNRICPGTVRAHYLDYWLRHDLPGRWLDKPNRIRAGFTLLLHDRPSDAVQAIRGLIKARRSNSDRFDAIANV